LERYLDAWKWLALWLQTERYHSPRAITYRNALEYIDWRVNHKKKSGKKAGRNTAIFELKTFAMIMGEAVRLGHTNANPLASLRLRRDAPAKKPAMFHEVTRLVPAAIAPTSAVAGVGRVTLLSNLPIPARQQVISAGRIASFRRRQVLFAAGDPVEHVILLTAGYVKTQQDSSNGNTVILRLNQPGDLLDADRLGGAGYRRFAAYAISHCTALFWSAGVFDGLTRRFSILQSNLSYLINGYLIDLEKRFCEMATESTESRVGHEISRLAQRIGEESNGAIRIRISQEDLAQLTGTTLYTVSRILSQWKEVGAVATGREFIEILNPQTLAEICESK